MTLKSRAPAGALGNVCGVFYRQIDHAMETRYPFPCPHTLCNHSFKRPNGLTHHLRHGPHGTSILSDESDVATPPRSDSEASLPDEQDDELLQ